jgi:hypothetical protein
MQQERDKRWAADGTTARPMDHVISPLWEPCDVSALGDARQRQGHSRRLLALV